jgi:ketosteroid isomerase-like protein
MPARYYLILSALFLAATALPAQASEGYPFDASPEHPYGLPNPAAPAELLDFAPLIGECDCESLRRNPDGSWADPESMVWRFKYIMNGMGVQDETLKSDGVHSGSIRQYSADSSRWYVHYYSSASPVPTLPSWEGHRQEDGRIVLYKEQAAPNGTDGYYRLTFSDIGAEGYNWIGEWVDRAETIVYPTWKIACTRRGSSVDAPAQRAIAAQAARFSQAYMDGDYDAMTAIYTKDAKIFPGNTAIISGHEAIRARWVLPEGVKILQHQSTPEEIRVLGDYAYDYGYYAGTTQLADGNTESWRGKYVIVWRRDGGVWKMYLDIWNRVRE